MNWDRGDDKKSSKIYYKIDGVGMENNPACSKRVGLHNTSHYSFTEKERKKHKESTGSSRS